MIAAGVISGLIAAPFGLVDWLAIPSGTRWSSTRDASAGAAVGTVLRAVS